MASILDFVKNPEVLSYARQLKAENFFGLTLFSPRRVAELDYEYIKGESGTHASIIADVVNWESSAPMAPHESLKKVEGELPPIKQKSRYSEQEIIKIFAPRSTTERNLAINKLYDDVAARVDGVHSRLNLIVMESLGNGTVVFASDGVKLTVDWGIPADQKVTPGVPWDTVATADPFADITALMNVIKTDRGVVVDRMLTSNTVIANLLQCVKLKKAIFGSSETDRVLTLAALNAFFASVGMPLVYSYDEQYKLLNADMTTTLTRYYPVKKATLYSSQMTLGETLYGPTAEAIRSIGVEESPGIWAEVFETKDPVNVWTYACAVAFPTFPASDDIGIFNALA